MAVDVARRELVTEAIAAGGFLAAAGALWATAGYPPPGWLALWLCLLCAVLVRVEFQLEEGHTRPVVLAVVPMLVLLPAPVVPLVVAAAHVASRLPYVVAGRSPAWRLMMMVADCWFALPAALILAVWGEPGDPMTAALVLAGAATAQVACDFVISALRLWGASA